MPLINCKVHLELNRVEGFILSSDGDSAKFKIMYAKLNIPIVTLSNKDNLNLTKKLSDGFERLVYWNRYQTIPAKVLNQGTNVYKLLSASFQGVKRLFVFAYDIVSGAANSEAGIKNCEKYFFPRGEIKN